LQPYLNKIKTFENTLILIDELRGRTVFFKETIKTARAGVDAKIAALKKK
jgi:preprotein translocase subunit SecA